MNVLSALERPDLLVPLVAAHLLADFVLQTDNMVAYKERWTVLLSHVGVVVVASWILLGHPVAGLPMVLLVGFFHLVIDLGKAGVDRWAAGAGGTAFWPRNGRAAVFLGDQALHLLSLLAVVAWVAPAEPGYWTQALGAPWVRFLVLVSGWIAATTGAGYFFGHFLQRFENELEPDQRGGLSGGGYWIGVTERSLIYLFILLGEPAAIGFLAAAKSVFRIGELRESKDRKLAEYILIGTLLSFAAAMLVGLATRAVLAVVV